MFQIGQKVKLSLFYQRKYPNWKVGIGIVTKEVSSKKFTHESLENSSALAPFMARFGEQKEYTLTSYLVDFSGKVALVANLGIESAE